MPRAHPLFRPFLNALFVDDQTFEWTRRGDDFCFRPQTAPLDVVWVLPGRSDFESQLALEDAGARVQPYIPASLKVAKAWRGRTCWRFWPLDGGDEFLVRPRFALLRNSAGQSAQFAFAKFSDYDCAGATAFDSWFDGLNAPASDLQAARRWLSLPTNQRLAQLVEVRGGTWDELIALINAAFVLWALPTSRFELDFTKAGPISIKRQLYWYTPPEPIDDALETLSQHWSLQRADLHDFARYWRGCDKFGDPMDVPQPAFGYGLTSQHERLEALLLWRDWLRDKLPTKQVEELLARVS